MITPGIILVPTRRVNRCNLDDMSPEVSTADLIDARGIADLLGYAHRNTVSVYQKRYPDMPRPVIDMGKGRPMLWLRSEIVAWASRTGRSHV